MSILLVQLALAFFVLAPFTSQAATLEECRTISPNHRPATREDSVVQNGRFTIGQCYNPSDVGVSQATEDAKKYLFSKLENDRTHVEGLNPEFACRLANFLKASEQQSPPHNIKITSGYRSEQRQAEVSRNGTNPMACGYETRVYTNCPHVNGRAADLRFNGAGVIKLPLCRTNEACKWAHENAGRFGLIFPLMPGVSKSLVEPWHIELNRSVATVQGSTQCGSVHAGPNAAPSALFNPTANPSPFSSGLHNLFGTQPPLPPQPMLPQQPFAQQQPIFNAFQPQQPQLPPLQPIVLIPGTTSTTTGSTSSIADQLLQLAFGTSSAPSSGSIGTSAPIIITGASAGTIASTQQPSSGSTHQSTSSGRLPVGQQTFVSSNLGAPTPTPTYNSRLFQILSTLKTALTMLLDYLRPFNAGYQLRNIDHPEAHGYE